MKKKARSRSSKTKRPSGPESLEALLGKIRSHAQEVSEQYNKDALGHHCGEISSALNQVILRSHYGELSSEEDRLVIAYFLSWIGEIRDDITVRGFCKQAKRSEILLETSRTAGIIECAGTGLLVKETAELARRIVQALWRSISRHDEQKQRRVSVPLIGPTLVGPTHAIVNPDPPPRPAGKLKERRAYFRQGRNLTSV